jgi:hypothetical protein
LRRCDAAERRRHRLGETFIISPSRSRKKSLANMRRGCGASLVDPVALAARAPPRRRQVAAGAEPASGEASVADRSLACDRRSGNERPKSIPAQEMGKRWFRLSFSKN